jgi:uncharacterized protein
MPERRRGRAEAWENRSVSTRLRFTMPDKAIAALLARAREDPEVLAVVLFGSRARDEALPTSDTDVCLVLHGRRYEPLDLSRKRLDFLSLGGLDVHVFQGLPLYVRRRVLREGRVLLVKDEDALYEIAFRTARAFEDFRHHYRADLEDVASDRS